METLMEYSWRLSEASNNFGFNLLSSMVTQKTKNIVFSPISISTTLGLIYHGSRGSTAKELEDILGYKSCNLTRAEVSTAFRYLISHHLITEKPIAYILDMATALFVNKLLKLNSTYIKDAEEIFRAPLETFDLTSRSKTVNRINDWVRNQTRNKIVGIVESLDSSEDLIAVNTLYFKSKWMTYFPEKNTRKQTFYNAGKTPKAVPMMAREDTYLHYEDNEVSIIHLSCWGENISMVILLPHRMDRLPDFEKSLSSQKLNKYLYDITPRMVKLKLPKFNISYSTDVSPIIHEMGATEIFQPTLANLSGIVLDGNVAVGELRHKAMIEVNESGVEASGFTAAFSFKSAPFPDDFPTKFIADHPFLFLIVDERTNLVLLMGRVWNL
nr:intracellular coagulation inhibitor 1 isoform X2 [Parasteatoda tepidariorum]